MMRSMMFAGCAALALPAAALAAPPGSVGWSMFGVSPRNADNSGALNSLPANQNIYCDTSGTIKLQKSWLLKSNLTISGLGTGQCPIRTSVSCSNVSCGWISQVDLGKPISNVAIDGLDFAGKSSTQGGLALYLWADHLTLTHFTIGTNHGWAYLRGADQEFGWCKVKNSPTAGGNPGFRHKGNTSGASSLTPAVATTATGFGGAMKPLVDGQPASVWLHDCDAQTGDAPYQISQSDQGKWPLISAVYYVYENLTATELESPLVLIGYSNDAGTVNDYTQTTQHVLVRHVSGKGEGLIHVHSNNAKRGGIADLRVEDSSVDASPQVSNAGGIEVHAEQSGTIKRVAFDNVTVSNSRTQALVWTGNVSDLSLTNSTLGPPRTGSSPTAILKSGANLTIGNTRITALAGNAITIGSGSLVSNADISNNQIDGITDQKTGMAWQNASGATSSSNVITPAAGSSKATGISLTAQTVHSVMTNNNVTALASKLAIKCSPPGQDNNVSGNPGAPDCPP